MKSIHPFIKNAIPVVVLFSAWSYILEDEQMHYPENMAQFSNNPHSPDYSSEFGRCFACDNEYVPEGDRHEPDLVCPNPQCDQSPHYVEE